MAVTSKICVVGAGVGGISVGGASTTVGSADWQAASSIDRIARIVRVIPRAFGGFVFMGLSPE
jgi:hypothetical protein